MKLSWPGNVEVEPYLQSAKAITTGGAKGVSFLPGFVVQQSLNSSLSNTQTHSTTQMTNRRQKAAGRKGSTMVMHSLSKTHLLIQPAWDAHARYCASPPSPLHLPDHAGLRPCPGHLTL